MLHSLFTHKINILAATIIVDMVQAMWICKASFVHSQIFSFVVHIVYKLDVVKSNTLVILGKINTSYF